MKGGYVLITGGAGFVGADLAERLTARRLEDPLRDFDVDAGGTLWPRVSLDAGAATLHDCLSSQPRGAT